MLKPHDLAYLKSIVQEAGDMALDYQNSNLDVRRKRDATIVTQADLNVQALLIQKIRERFADLNFIYEENFAGESASLNGDTLTAIIDPIDGTAMYSMHLPIWCVSLGIFRGVQPLYGFVYAPAAGLFFHNDNDSAYVNDVPAAVDHDLPVEAETNIFYASEIHRRYRVEFPGKVRNLGSTALQASLVIDNHRNRTMAFIGRSYLWDWAGAIPIILKAGGSVACINGSPVDYGAIVANGCYLPDFIIAHSCRSFDAIRPFFIPL
jgi:myo-inositol-1(or 4)-monophosphatase